MNESMKKVSCIFKHSLTPMEHACGKEAAYNAPESLSELLMSHGLVDMKIKYGNSHPEKE